MMYHTLSYLEKIEALQSHFKQSTRLSEVIGVSRRTLLNWRDRPESMSLAHRLDVDVLYCKHMLVPEWDDPKWVVEDRLLPDDLPQNERLFTPLLRRLSYGTIEIETDMKQADFDRIIDNDKLPKNMTRHQFHEAMNAFLTHKQLWQRIVERQDHVTLDEQAVLRLHADFMRGVNDHAGFYSDKIRVMGKLEGVSTTLPEDIPEEMNRWVFKHAQADTIEDIAKAHAYFIAIHPFGDGNGRVGRALVMMQCLHARLMPPVLDGGNRAMYYAAMEYAMRHGRYRPLIRLFHEAAR